MKLFIKDIISVGSSKIIIILCNLSVSIISARWIGPEGNGIISALAVYPSLFLTFGALGISQSATHFVGHGKFEENELKNSIIHIWFFSTTLSMISSFLLMHYFSNSGANPLWNILAILPIPFTLFNTYNSGIFLGKNQIKAFNQINWIPAFFGIIFTVIFIIVFSLDITGVLLANIMGPLAMFGILIFKHNSLKYFVLKVNWKIIRSLLSLGLIYAISLLIINLNYKVDIILLDNLSDSYNVGIYAKAVSITDFLWQIPMLLSSIIFARSSNAKNGIEFSEKVSKILRISIVLIGIGSIFFLIFSRLIIQIMFGSEFEKSADILQLLLPGVLLLTIFKVLNMDLAGKGKPWVSMKAMIPAVIINIILNIILIPNYGAGGSALSTTISYSIAALLFLHFYSKEVKIPIKKIFDYSKSDLFVFIPILKKIKILR